jgi:hypothetical protein
VSRLEDAIGAGRFVVTAELLTVNAGGLDAVQERFAPYADYVDATNATDNTSAHAHASPLAVAIALQQLGMEPVMQLTCRDRNRLALEAEIAGLELRLERLAPRGVDALADHAERLLRTDDDGLRPRLDDGIHSSPFLLVSEWRAAGRARRCPPRGGS